jgi:hypothetical protein
MVEEVGTMRFRVQGEEIKKWWKKKMMCIKKKEIDKKGKNMYEKNMNLKICMRKKMSL